MNDFLRLCVQYPATAIGLGVFTLIGARVALGGLADIVRAARS